MRCLNLLTKKNSIIPPHSTLLPIFIRHQISILIFIKTIPNCYPVSVQIQLDFVSHIKMLFSRGIFLIFLIISPTLAKFKSDKIGACLVDKSYQRNYEIAFKVTFICFESVNADILNNSTILKCRNEDHFMKLSIFEVNFFNCEFAAMPAGFFTFYKNIEAIDASKLSLTSFGSENVDEMNSLFWLMLSNNELKEVPSFGTKNRLKHLDLSNNPIENLHAESFKNLKYLELLNLTATQLVELPANVFIYQENLQEVDLSKNLLHNIDTNIFLPSFYSLQRIFLDCNSLSEINDLPKQLFFRLEVLSLNSNSETMRCDQILNFLNQNEWKDGLFLSRDIKSKNIDEINENSFLCNNNDL